MRAKGFHKHTILKWYTMYSHNITKQLHNGLFPKKEVAVKKKLIIYSYLSKSWVYSLSAPHKRVPLKLKENYAYVKPSPTEHNQGGVYCYVMHLYNEGLREGKFHTILNIRVLCLLPKVVTKPT